MRPVTENLYARRKRGGTITRLICGFCCLALCASSAISQTNSGAVQDDAPGIERLSRVLFDYRRQPPYRTPQLSAQRRRAILRAVYGGRAVKNLPNISSVATGSFTQRGVKQTAYLIQQGSPAAADPASLSGVRLAIFAGNRMVANTVADGYGYILRTSDLNHDGVDELLLEGSFLNMGTTVSSARLVELKNGRLRVVKDFGRVFKDTCGSEQDQRIVAGVIRYAPVEDGRLPEFRLDLYQGACVPSGADADSRSFHYAPDAIIEE